MSIRLDHSITLTYSAKTSHGNTLQAGEIVKPETLASVNDGVLMQLGEENVERVYDGVVLRTVSHAVTDDQASAMMVHSGLVPSTERIELVRHVIVQHIPLERDLLLNLDALWRQLDYRPAWLPILMRLAKSKLPLTKLSATALRKYEEGQPNSSTNTTIYIYIDLTATPSRYSVHHMSREQEPTGEEHDDQESPHIVIGCDAPHLGPVLILVDRQANLTRIELLVGDEERCEYIAQELSELRDRLMPLVQELTLQVGRLPTNPVERSPVTPMTTHLDNRV